MAETGGRIDPLRGLLGVVLGLALVALVGMFLVIGKSLILPIVVAVISVYVLIAASDAVGRLPGCRRGRRFRRAAPTARGWERRRRPVLRRCG